MLLILRSATWPWSWDIHGEVLRFLHHRPVSLVRYSNICGAPTMCQALCCSALYILSLLNSIIIHIFHIGKQAQRG